MKLDDLIATVEKSMPDQWHKMESQTLYGWASGTMGEYPYIEAKTFDTLCVYKPDVDVSLAIGATVNETFEESWNKRFPDPIGRSLVVRLLYRGSPIYEWVFVSVDGGRYLLPMPERVGDDNFGVKKENLPLARLFFQLYGPAGVHDRLEDALKRAGVAVLS
jgi:hypothetical protein